MGAYRQTGPYMPQADGPFRDWLANFADRVNDDPHMYGLTTADAAIIENHRNSYDEALRLATQPISRTPAAIAGKDAIKASAMASMRVYAGLVRAIAAIGNEDRISLGLKPSNPSRSPIPAPVSAPLLMPICGYPLVTCLRYADETTPASRRKPVGAQFLQLAIAVIEPGQRLPIRPDDATTYDVFTRQPILVNHRQEDVAKTAVFFGRWVTARGLTGPWSMPAYFTVVAGGSVGSADGLTKMRAPELEKLTRVQQRQAA